MAPVPELFRVNGHTLTYDEFTKEVLRTIKRADKASPIHIRTTLQMHEGDEHRLWRVLQKLVLHGFLRQQTVGLYQVHPMLLIEGV